MTNCLDGMRIGDFKYSMEVTGEEAIRASEVLLSEGGDPTSFCITADGSAKPYRLRLSQASYFRLKLKLRKELEG